MAENSEPFCSSLARFIENRTRIPTRYFADGPWQERERLFDLGSIHILWLCGLPYVHKADSWLELLAAPVPQGLRYQGRPIYFSDVVVRRDCRFQKFFDLRGSTLAYNEPRSHSGFNVVRAYLAEFGFREGFFGAVLESGAHSVSLDLVMSGRVDAAAIDSTVLEWFTVRRRELADELRVIETIGPSPVPPWVISRRVPEGLRRKLRTLLLGMHGEPFGRVMLDQAGLDRFVEASDGDYDSIRTLAMKAREVSLTQLC